MKNIFYITLLLIGWNCIAAQNIIIQQNNQPSNGRVVEKVVEKNVYIPVRASSKKEAICLHGYLYVYPEDLGSFSKYPASVIANINNNKVYGKSHWRLPTSDEFTIMWQYYEELKLKRSRTYVGGAFCIGYWLQGMENKIIDDDDRCYYYIRLVCTE